MIVNSETVARHKLIRRVAMAAIVVPVTLLAACAQQPAPAPATVMTQPASPPPASPPPVVPKARG